MKILTFLLCFIPSFAYAEKAHIEVNVVELTQTLGWQSGHTGHNEITVIDNGE